MTDKAIVRLPQRAGVFSLDEAAPEVAGLEVEHDTPTGSIVRGDREALDALAAAGARVKLLPDTNLIRIYDYVIDVEAADVLDEVPTRARVPRARRADWPHFLVQLDGPPIPEWIDAIEACGVDVVEPIGAYGLFVVGDAEHMAEVGALDFVAWWGMFEPAWRVAPPLRSARGRVPVRIGVCPPEYVDGVVAAVEGASGSVRHVHTADPGTARPGLVARIAVVSADLDAAAARNDIARLPWVRFVEPDEPMELDDERSAQIIAESLTGTGGAAVPTTGYGAVLTGVGIDGTGVTIAVVDSGIDTHVNATLHPDLQGRLAFFVDQTAGAATADRNGHGTHVASIAAGDGTTGDTDPGGFTLGLGVAPGAQVGSLNVLGAGSAAIDFSDQVANAVTNGAQVMNNSWGGSTNNEGYVSQAAEVDSGVRDPDPATAVQERIVVVFSAGNNGGFPRSITRPHECKNAIVVGNSLNARPGELFVGDDIRGISPSSSRGPAVDNRMLPHVVAPGTDIVAARSSVDNDPTTPGVQQNRAAYTDAGGTAHAQHTVMTGTSMAAPHVSGLSALLVEWWRNRTGQLPSAALAKALLVNTAEDIAGGPNWRRLPNAWTAAGANFRLSGMGINPAQLAEQQTATTWSTMNQVASVAAIANPGDWSYAAGTDTITIRTVSGTAPMGRISALDPTPLANIPNSDQGWGRVSLDNLFLTAPASDRGPRVVLDERLGFDTNGQEWTIRVAAVDPTRPLRITLSWTDAPGAAGANPALQNDLDLEVTETATGTVFRGNVFANGFSTTGGAFDTLNNTECVYIANPNGVYEVTVIAATLRADARPPFSAATPWQDFALVLDNAEVPADEPVDVALCLDRSGSMVWSGYVDVTRTSARSFVDLMAIDDAVGVASFGSTATDDFPSTSPASLRTIATQVDRDAATAAITGLSFGGSTMMGPGLQRAADMLPPGAGRKAIVLLSDGYDNGTPDARTVAGGLPADVAVYSCAMGPLSDQTLLEDIAASTNGRYLYMPTIDDLFLILNVIREQVTGDGLVVNERHTASASRVGAWVESAATEATFLVNWADPELSWSVGDPKAGEINVRLRMPNGRVLHPFDPSVRRMEGPGHVAFRVEEPVAGQWWVEVTTARRTHAQYAVGGFVRSPIRIDATINPLRPLRRTPLDVRVDVWDGARGVVDLTGKVCLMLPMSWPGKLVSDYRRRLKGLPTLRSVRRDVVPPDLREALALSRSLQKEGKAAIAHRTKCTSLKKLVVPTPPGGGGEGGPVVVFPAATLAVGGPTTLHATVSGALYPGSVNAKVTVQGSTEAGVRFVRTTMRSVRIA